jgi:hypothetical protein
MFEFQLHDRSSDWPKSAFNWIFPVQEIHKQNALLIGILFDDVGGKLQHSLHKYLARLTQQVHVSITAEWRVTKSLHLRPHKIAQVQSTEEGTFVSGFFG